jgi:hypothetical protein
MAVAMIFSEPGKALRGHRSESVKVIENITFNGQLLSRARLVLKWVPELAPSTALFGSRETGASTTRR